MRSGLKDNEKRVIRTMAYLYSKLLGLGRYKKLCEEWRSTVAWMRMCEWKGGVVGESDSPAARAHKRPALPLAGPRITRLRRWRGRCAWVCEWMREWV